MLKGNKILNKAIVLQALFLLLCVQVSFGQTYSDDDKTDSENIQDINNIQSLFSSFGISNQINTRNSSIQGNTVFIRQVGLQNTVGIATETNASDIKLTQNGNNNLTALDYTANTAYADLVQNGNNNKIIDYVNDSQADISLELVQNGDNIYFERNGVNSITKSLKFTQTEASPTIIVRSNN